MWTQEDQDLDNAAEQAVKHEFRQLREAPSWSDSARSASAASRGGGSGKLGPAAKAAGVAGRAARKGGKSKLAQKIALHRAFRKAGGKQRTSLTPAQRRSATKSDSGDWNSQSSTAKKGRLKYEDYDEGKAEGDKLEFSRKGKRWTATDATSAYGFGGGRGKSKDIRPGQKFSKKRALSLVRKHRASRSYIIDKRTED